MAFACRVGLSPRWDRGSSQPQAGPQGQRAVLNGHVEKGTSPRSPAQPEGLPIEMHQPRTRGGGTDLGILSEKGQQHLCGFPPHCLSPAHPCSAPQWVSCLLSEHQALGALPTNKLPAWSSCGVHGAAPWWSAHRWANDCLPHQAPRHCEDAVAGTLTITTCQVRDARLALLST